MQSAEFLQVTIGEAYRYERDRKRTYNVILRRVRATIVEVEKLLSITHSECVFVVFIIRHAIRMRRVILSSVACLVLP
jgi:cell division protein FtsL